MNDATGFLEPFLGGILPWLYADSVWWTVFGLLGTAVFGFRFYVQWLYSERRGRLVVPARPLTGLLVPCTVDHEENGTSKIHRFEFRVSKSSRNRWRIRDRQ